MTGKAANLSEKLSQTPRVAAYISSIHRYAAKTQLDTQNAVTGRTCAPQRPPLPCILRPALPPCVLTPSRHRLPGRCAAAKLCLIAGSPAAIEMSVGRVEQEHTVSSHNIGKVLLCRVCEQAHEDTGMAHSVPMY